MDNPAETLRSLLNCRNAQRSQTHGTEGLITSNAFSSPPTRELSRHRAIERISFKSHSSDTDELIGSNAIQSVSPKTLRPSMFLNSAALFAPRSQRCSSGLKRTGSTETLSSARGMPTNAQCLNHNMNVPSREHSNSARSSMTSQSLCDAFQLYRNRHQSSVTTASPSMSEPRIPSNGSSKATSQEKMTAPSDFKRDWRSFVSQKRNNYAISRGANSSGLLPPFGQNSCSSGEDSSGSLRVMDRSDDSGDSMYTQSPVRVRRSHFADRKRGASQMLPHNRHNLSDSGYSSSNFSHSSSTCSSFTPWTDKIISQGFQPLPAPAPDAMPIPFGSVPAKTLEAMSPGAVSPRVAKEHQFFCCLQPGLDTQAKARNVRQKRSHPNEPSEAKRSRPHTREHRFRRTADALQESGLMGVAMKTGNLIKRNQDLQRDLDQFKVESLNFLKSVLKNPQNKKLIKQVLNNALIENPPNRKWSLISSVMTAAFKLGINTVPPTDTTATDPSLPDVKVPMPTPLTVPNPTSKTVPMSTTCVPMPTPLYVPMPTFLSNPVPGSTPLTVPMPSSVPALAAGTVPTASHSTVTMPTPLTVPVPNSLTASMLAVSTVTMSSASANPFSESHSNIPLVDGISTIPSNAGTCSSVLPTHTDICGDVLNQDVNVSLSTETSASITADLNLGLPVDLVDSLPPDITVSVPLDVGCSMSIDEGCGVCSHSMTDGTCSREFIGSDLDQSDRQPMEPT